TLTMDATSTRRRFTGANVALGLLLLSLSFTVSAQSQGLPKPPPEQKAMAAWVGQWKYHMDTKVSPLGPAENIDGQITYRLVMNGFYLEGKWSEKHDDGTVEGLEMYWYDAGTKTHKFDVFGSDGFVTAGTETVDGKNW